MALLLRVLSVCAVLGFAGCGGGGGGGGDGGGDDDAGGSCIAEGDLCGPGADCCAGTCDALTGVCLPDPQACAGAGESCTNGPDCCTFSCVGGECSATQCVADGETCTSGEECCGGACPSGTCVPLNASCSTSGNPCDGHGDCCSDYCVGGLCSATPSYCTQQSDACVADADCCSGMCTRAEGASLGVCALVPAPGAGGCTTAGEVCGAGATYDGGPLPLCGGECCSRACFPYGPTGVLICQPPSGCRPTGEICAEDTDCCGSAGQPDGDTANIVCAKVGSNPYGRCNQGNACTPAGGICRLQEVECQENANCCSGNVLINDTCKRDSLGIPRCLVAEIDCTDPGSFEGDACATSADCCGLPCVPNPNGDDPPLVCGGMCLPTGGGCTTSADCCAGLPCDPTTGTCGETIGCSDYGQECTDSGDCCNEVPCTNGVCQLVVE